MEALTRRCAGIVREFDAYRGCGTIETNAGEMVFVRYSAIQGQGVRVLREGDRVTFFIEQSYRGPNAVGVVRE